MVPVCRKSTRFFAEIAFEASGLVKNQALWLYQKLTARSRQQTLQLLRQERRLPIGILFYHRVADTQPNPWTLSRHDFSRQLDWLQDNFEIVGLQEAQRRIQNAESNCPTISITFDDGYADNAHFAIPELVRRSLPATYFVATEFVKMGQPFPHDLQAGTPLAPNSIDELREFQTQGIEIGAHTRTHADLGLLHDQTKLRDEIVGSADTLADWLGSRPRYFAFPFGLPENTSQAAVDIIRDSGFEGFCTAYGAWNWPDTAGYHLRRIHADPGLERLKNWLTFDSRKLRDRRDLPFEEVLPVGATGDFSPQTALVEQGT